MAEATAPKSVLNTEKFVQDILQSIERDREREIVARRFGLFDRRETLEQIGELLGITRERVRQLEKSVVARFKASAEQGQLPHIKEAETALSDQLQHMGNAARVSELTTRVTAENSKTDQSRVIFLATLCPRLAVIEEDDNHYQAVGLGNVRDADAMKVSIAGLVSAIDKIGEPAPIADVAKAAGLENSSEAAALASISKHLATLNNRWGLVKWPMVNPKNIRDKIYVILKENGKHMHFNEIAESIKKSEFKRKDVTTQAIHNELIKDKRFVLIGRGIYALKEWGYSKGTVADIITQVLREAGEPLHRDEIVKRVLKSRFVKETTILLNLQGKNQFKRVAKATYELDEAGNGA
ncbi:MAG TPA: sigma factor-like helix-turn-helix DNA-binding protein [Candidatus Saccharimonadales bacterium]|nr:sigma factor-like helix-turn-helix DNA-binding protein [Candidatus Saccharimonadales bacterium]